MNVYVGNITHYKLSNQFTVYNTFFLCLKMIESVEYYDKA